MFAHVRGAFFLLKPMKNQHFCLPGAPSVPAGAGVPLVSPWGSPGSSLGVPLRSSWGPPGVHLGTTFCYSQSDIGTEIIFVHCFATKIIRPFINQSFRKILKALVETYRSTLSKRDLKHSGTFFFENLYATLDSQVTVFLDFCPRRATQPRSLQSKLNKHITSECQAKEYL